MGLTRQANRSEADGKADGPVRAAALSAVLVFLTGSSLATPGLERPPANLPESALTVDEFPLLLPSASDFAICIAERSYRGCCSNHQGVKDIRDDKLICLDETPSRTCNGVAAPLKGCCSNHDGVFGVNTDGVVVCGDQTTSPSCHLGLCESDEQ